MNRVAHEFRCRRCGKTATTRNALWQRSITAAHVPHGWYVFVDLTEENVAAYACSQECVEVLVDEEFAHRQGTCKHDTGVAYDHNVAAYRCHHCNVIGTYTNDRFTPTK